MRAIHLCMVLGLCVQPALAEDKPFGKLFESKSGAPLDVPIEKLLVDNAAGSVSAAALAGVESDSMNVVENVRDFSVLVKGFDASAKAFGVAVTPARTHFAWPSYTLGEYERSHLTRWLASFTLSYAQGSSDIEKAKFTRRAVSLSTSAFWNAAEDPVVVIAQAKECGIKALAALGPDKPAVTQAEADAAVAAARSGVAAAGASAPGAAGVAPPAKPASDEQNKAARKAWEDCVTPLLKKAEEKWNRTRYSVSYGTGNVQRTDGTGDTVRLGHTAAVSLVYGFDGVDALKLKDRAAMALTVRRSSKEPVLTSLATGPVKFKSSTLAGVRLSGGSSVFRGLVELNNARDTDVTTTQRQFRRAVGIDYRLMDGLWLNLRYGKQRKLDGSGKDETGSFLSLNYSPSALLGR